MQFNFIDLFTYNHQSNQKMIDVFLNHSGIKTEKSIQWMNHVLNAHHIWNHRILELTPQLSVWGVNDLGELKEIDFKNYKQTMSFVEHADLNQLINYSTSTGDKFANTIQDILFHVINHSTYHRGQIASRLKENGIEPPSTDFIMYKRG